MSLDWDVVVFELKDWLIWIGGSMIAALIIINVSSAVMGTGTPFIAVTTGSMVHDARTSRVHVQWFKDRSVSEQEIESFPLSGGFNPGDAIIVLGVKPEKVEVGDVIVFDREGYSMPIIHRVYNITLREGVYYFRTKGDHNSVPDPWIVSEEDVQGRAWLWIPFIGVVNTLFARLVSVFTGG